MHTGIHTAPYIDIASSSVHAKNGNILNRSTPRLLLVDIAKLTIGNPAITRYKISDNNIPIVFIFIKVLNY